MQNDLTPFSFNVFENPPDCSALKSEWRQTLSAPQDGMWEAFTDQAIHWELKCEGQQVGYACVDADNQLLQFYVQPRWLPEAVAGFQQFIQERGIKQGIIGTNNPFFLGLALHHQKSVQVHTYLFSNHFEESPSQEDTKLTTAVITDLEGLVEFYHLSTGGPKDWLAGYLEKLIEGDELFFLEEGGEIIGSCEVRKSETNPGVADIGMVVSPKHRRKGFGTYLLGEAKEIALSWGWQPICSCEKGNIGSLKSIHKNGFRSIHQMLLVEF